MSTINVATPSGIILNAAQEKRLADFRNATKMSLWMIKALPAAWFMGVRIKNISPERSEIKLPYGWRSQNPFQSIYFAAQCAAGEYATGMLATLALEGREKVSMLVTHVEADFFKKANSETIFSCNEGLIAFQTIDRAIETNQAQTLVMTSRGVQKNGEVVSEVRVTWSFKKRSK